MSRSLLEPEVYGDCYLEQAFEMLLMTPEEWVLSRVLEPSEILERIGVWPGGLPPSMHDILAYTHGRH